MNKESETAGDQEPFSELVETPNHPLLINIVPPFVNEINLMFHFQLNGETLWRLREVCGQPSSVSASTIKYSASWLLINGICFGACWKCCSRKYQAVLEKKSKRQNHDETGKNSSRDVY